MKSRRPQRRNPQQARAKITVDAICDAATRIFTERGFARSSTNAIAQQAGVSVGSLYQYFPDKLALLSALHDRHLDALMRAMTAACRTHAHSGLEPALRAIITTAAEQHLASAPLERVFARHLPVGQPNASPAAAEFQAALRALLVKHRRELRIADHDLALFMLRNLGRSVMEGAANARPGDLRNGMMTRELLASAMAFLTGDRKTRRPRAAHRVQVTLPSQSRALRM